MQKRLIPSILLTLYSALLIKVMVFKDLPVIRVGGLMFKFGGKEAVRPPNFVPFRTIAHYVFGSQGIIIGGINLVGNIALLVPIGFLVPLVYRTMTWKKAVILGIAAGLVIELLQTVLHVGIFDIDDLILNALGVLIGYGMFVLIFSSSKNA